MARDQHRKGSGEISGRRLPDSRRDLVGVGVPGRGVTHGKVGHPDPGPAAVAAVGRAEGTPRVVDRHDDTAAIQHRHLDVVAALVR